jgi:3-oxoacyl-[acyl-carrier protein] reductase
LIEHLLCCYYYSSSSSDIIIIIIIWIVIGGTDTDMMSSTPAAFIEMAKNSSPQKRLGTVSDIGDATALLASESARWISGQHIVVAGGAV